MSDAHDKHRRPHPGWPEFLEYMRAAVRRWVPLVTGVVGAVLTVVSLFAHGFLFFVVGIVLMALALVGAQFQAWWDMRCERDQIQEELNNLRAQLAGQRTAEARRAGLALLVRDADMVLFGMEAVADGSRPERPVLEEPRPTGDAQIDRHRQLLHRLQVQMDAASPPPWRRAAADWTGRCRTYLQSLEPSVLPRFDHPMGMKPSRPCPFEAPEAMAEIWEAVALRQERLLGFLAELPSG